MIGAVLTGAVEANPPGLKGEYKKPTINQRFFGADLAMVGNERDEYATNLVSYAVKILRAKKGDQPQAQTVTSSWSGGDTAINAHEDEEVLH